MREWGNRRSIIVCRFHLNQGTAENSISTHRRNVEVIVIRLKLLES